MKKIVCIGGGLGASRILLGLSKYDFDLIGLIAVTDSGRSTGKVRIAANIPAPGDIRNTLVYMSKADPFLKQLFQFRFHSPKLNELDGMAFGNLFIAALSQMLGSFEKAVEKTSQFLKIRGRVIPIMLADTHIACEREDGSFSFEDANVMAFGKSPIKRMFLTDGAVSAHPAGVKAIKQANLVTIGPGSLYTTVVACLLTPGIPEALAKTKAKVVAVLNTTTQPGQTDRYDLTRHLKTLQSYLPPNTIDSCLVNIGRPDTTTVRRLAKNGLKVLQFNQKDKIEMKALGVKVISADLIETQRKEDKVLWNKQDTIRHDPKKLAQVLLKLL